MQGWKKSIGNRKTWNEIQNYGENGLKQILKVERVEQERKTSGKTEKN